MPYELHITRADDWLESRTSPIPVEEWQALVDHHPDLHSQDHVVAINPMTQEELKVPLANGACLDVNGGPLYFSCRDGRVSVGAIDELIPQVKNIADQLGARLFGDEGEEY
jgi:hypothetical protein